MQTQFILHRLSRNTQGEAIVLTGDLVEGEISIGDLVQLPDGNKPAIIDLHFVDTEREGIQFIKLHLYPVWLPKDAEDWAGQMLFIENQQ